MKRDLERMASRHYDLLLVGGGITGACVAWDAASRGLRVALVEKSDFGGATSAATSKLIHGGLRYLKNFELSIVRESLAERRLMEVLAPHLVHPFPFLIPTYRFGKNNKPMIKAGMVFYDLLAFDKKRIEDEDKRIPDHRTVGRAEVLALEPGVKPDKLTGGAIYYDCQMESPERLTLEFIHGAARRGADVTNYAEVVDLVSHGQRVEGVKVVDHATGRTHEIEARVVGNVSGPWADITLGMLKGSADRKVRRSKGIHLVTRSISREYAVVLRTKTGGHFFIIPWRGHSLIGTTDVEYSGSPDACRVTERDIGDFLDDINWAYPGAALTREDVLYFYGGMRPIVEKDTKTDVYDASRRYEVYDHAADDGIEGLITVIGGKYTTSRALAKKMVDLVAAKLGQKGLKCTTASTPPFGGNLVRLASYIEEESLKRPFGLTGDLVENLIRTYGTRYVDVLSCAADDPAALERLSPERKDLKAQVVYAVKEEMAQRVTDVIFRRTGLGTIGHPGADCVDACAFTMAGLLGWDRARMDQEVAAVEDVYRTG